MKARTLVFAIALLVLAGNAHAQDGTLERVQNLIATGRLTEARNTLAQWERANGDPASATTPGDRARALFLSGVLSTDAAAAEDAFLGVVLSYPSSAVAPEALLRLGQSLHTAGQSDRAIVYLDRLISDYPGATQRQTGLLWLARAQLATGAAAAACGTARESLLATSDQNVRTLIELERDKACTQSGGIALSSASTHNTPVDPAVQNAGMQPGTPQSVVVQPAPAPVTRRLPDLGIAVDSGPQQTADRTSSAQESAATDARIAEPRREPYAPPQVDTRPTDAPADAAATRSEEFAVQTAVFSERRAAETIAAELRAKGFDARIVTVPGSTYFRVRYGAFATSRDAAAAALRIRDAGFATLIVNDVRLERRP